MSNTERLDYSVVISKYPFEIRNYPSMIFAEVEIPGARKQAIREGFKILADYIFGNNTSTKPGPTELSEKIAMTAPVIQQKAIDKWKVRFIMPKKYNLETLPKPHSKNIRLVTSTANRFAVIQFSGTPNDENIEGNTKKLRDYIVTEKLKPIGEVILAFYNPPWTLPFLRRNEIMIEIRTDQ